MEQIEQLRREVARQSLAMRLGLSSIILGSSVRACITVRRAVQYRAIFENLLDDMEVPGLTAFFCTFPTPIVIILAILGVISVAVLFLWPKQIWAVPFGIASAFLSLILCELALLAFQTPFLTALGEL